MDLLSHDILIVGGGGAGLRAAIAIGEEDPRLSVGVISKVYPMRSHTVSAEGGAAGVIAAGMPGDRDPVGKGGDDAAHGRQELFGIGHGLVGALLEHRPAVLVHQLDA